MRGDWKIRDWGIELGSPSFGHVQNKFLGYIGLHGLSDTTEIKQKIEQQKKRNGDIGD